MPCSFVYRVVADKRFIARVIVRENESSFPRAGGVHDCAWILIGNEEDGIRQSSSRGGYRALGGAIRVITGALKRCRRARTFLTNCKNESSKRDESRTCDLSRFDLPSSRSDGMKNDKRLDRFLLRLILRYEWVRAILNCHRNLLCFFFLATFGWLDQEIMAWLWLAASMKSGIGCDSGCTLILYRFMENINFALDTFHLESVFLFAKLSLC